VLLGKGRRLSNQLRLQSLIRVALSQSLGVNPEAAGRQLYSETEAPRLQVSNERGRRVDIDEWGNREGVRE